MALTYVSNTISSATASATACPCAYPASIAAGNILVMLVGTKPFNAVIATPDSWQSLGQVTNGSTGQGADTGSVLQAAYAKEANGTETGSITVNISAGQTSYVAIYRFTKAAGQAVNFATAFGTDTTANTSWSVAFSSNPGITSGDHIVLGSVISTDTIGTYSVSALAATSATFSGIVAAGDNSLGITTGNDLGAHTNHLNCSAGTASANATWTATSSVGTNNAGSAVLVRLREIAPGTPSATLTLGAHQ